MSINHAILGMLSFEPLTGYDLKRIIEHTPFMYWSGNNNQIYKAFAELLDEGFVTKEVKHQDGSPSKNIYTITDDGQHELKSWLLSVTDVPVFKKEFLIKLALSDQLKRGDLENMLASYADVVKMQAVLSERKLDKCYFAEQKSSGKVLLLDLIRENIQSFYSNELEWVQKVKRFIAGLPDERSMMTETVIQKENNEVKSTMDYQIMESKEEKYLYLKSSGPLFHGEQDALDIISLCIEHDTNAVLLEGDSLSDDFVKLRTGLAGAVLQKLGTYIKVAVTIKDGQKFPVRFQEMVSELSARNTFRIFTNLEDAVSWLLT
ncbi:DUF4180 domain-containing protein [Caproiciproducens sp. CPB-2]|uniref:DUF4180 domain-containing protein n=1 Tax=Caproiciproducens sp. CPB-2 TaxID=3030017 RepID=UPI0023D985CC|nr:DUF4180 domain-containing protein [Caproiciproducens sp. CPB-2]MDF1493931.1 DUF4180 domain-containing protein [Caproiciproducens sp. CPB-2]